MAERVTVAVDGGPASEAALAWVIDRAKDVELYLEITTVVGLDSDLPDSTEDDYRSPLEKALLNAKTTVEAAVPHLAVTTKIRHGLPHEALVNASRHTDLLVIGTNKTSPIVGIVHGTLPLKVAGQAECTVVVVPVNWQPAVGVVVAGWSDDATAEVALDFAAEEAARRKEGLVIIHTWSAPPAASMDGGTPAIVVEELIAVNRQLLADATHRIQHLHPDVTVTQGMHAGSAAVAIVRAASDASLVVIGSRGRGAIAGFFLGSVSHDVLLNMPAPVAVISKKHEPVDVYPDLVDEDI